jgi:hypothetical protein
MKLQNLQFYDVIKGKKPHYIFKQDDVFYVMTSMDEDQRGNFVAIKLDEVNKVKARIKELNLYSFHPKQINLYRYMPDESHREHRLRCICYILVADKSLEMEKAGRELHFRVLRKYHEQEDIQLKPKKVFSHTTEYDYYNNKKKQLNEEIIKRGVSSSK